MASISGSSTSLLDQLRNQSADTEVKVETAFNEKTKSYVGKAGGSVFLEGTSTSWGKFKAACFPNQVAAARTAAFEQIKKEIGEKYNELPEFKANVMKSFENTFKKGEAVLADAVIKFVEMQDKGFGEEKARQAAPLKTFATGVAEVAQERGGQFRAGVVGVGKGLAREVKGFGSSVYSMFSTDQEKKDLAAAREAQIDAELKEELNEGKETPRGRES